MAARRKFEIEANQAYCEQELLRGEVIRLRKVHGALADFIEASWDGGQVPADIAEAIEAVFPVVEEADIAV